MRSNKTISFLQPKEYDLIKNSIDPLNPLSKQLYIYENKDDKLKIVDVHCDEVASCENDTKRLYDEILYKLEFQEKDNKNVSCRDSSDFFR